MVRQQPKRRRTREEYARGLADYHDPLAGIGGAAPTYSALTLRIVMASVAIVLCLAAGALFVILHVLWGIILLSVLTVICVVDLVWVIHRKRRGEPG
jgi:hypothetical protein